MASASFVNYYEVLQVSETADAAQIKAAVSQQRRTWIKRQGSADAARRVEAEARVRHIDEAERVLLVPAQRQSFDAQLANHVATGPEPSGEASSDWLDRARGYLEVGNAAAANRAAKEATTRRGNDHEAWSIRARSSFQLGQATDCEFEFAEAIRIAPDIADYHQDLGEAYLMQDKWNPAMGEFERALRLSPGNPVTRTSMAQVMINTNRTPQALDIMEGVVKENPNNEVFKFYLAVALDSSARHSLTELRDGSIIVTSAAQATKLDQVASRMASLNLTDVEVRDSIAELRGLASSSRRMMWVHSSNWQAYAFVLAILLCGMCGGLGSGDGGGIAAGLLIAAPLAALLVFVYVQRHRKANYAHASQVLSGQIVRRGI